MNIDDTNSIKDAFIHEPYKKQSSFRMEYCSLSKGVLIGCLVISWTCFIAIISNFIQQRGPSNGIFGHNYNISTYFSNFYSIGSPEIGRVASINFPNEKVYHVNGIAYDKYSISELGQTKVAKQWLTFPLPNELNRRDYPTPWYPPHQFSNNREEFLIKESPRTSSDLAYVEQIYVITDESFTERHKQLKETFRRHRIPIESIDFRWKWNRTTCEMKENLDEVRKKLNPAQGSHIRREQCPIVMKHVDVWYEMIERNISLGFILEDDPIFVPFFKEKFNRVIYTAIRTGALKLNKTCLNQTQKKIDDYEWINQESMFVIGICLDMFDKSFERNLSNAQPIITTHKQGPSRCAHAYLITLCAAKEMINILNNHRTNTDTPDFFLNFIYPRSSILQSFWIDPPLVYQGNHIVDMEHLKTYIGSTYNQKFRK